MATCNGTQTLGSLLLPLQLTSPANVGSDSQARPGPWQLGDLVGTRPRLTQDTSTVIQPQGRSCASDSRAHFSAD